MNGNPFSLRSALLLVAGGAVLFVALLAMIGAGMGASSANDGGGHGAGKGLNGFAGFARLLEAQGRVVHLSRSEKATGETGLLVLTPPTYAEGTDIERMVNQHRNAGPTVVVTPKWQAVPIPATVRPQGAKEGWVQLGGTAPPQWKGFLDDVGVAIGPMRGGSRWLAQGFSGELPDPAQVLTGSGVNLVPLVSGADGGILAAYLADGGHYPDLEAMALERPAPTVGGQQSWPLIVVFEPDLIDNYGLARQENARLALLLVSAASNGEAMPVTFDLTLNGHARTSNLLTLGFTPPFLAATLCLLLAALAVGWMAFARFGPPRKTDRIIAFGKRTLVANAAGLMRRAHRLHLIAEPYVERARDRISQSLALPRQAGHEATDKAIDRAMAARSPDSPPFTELARRLRAARNQDAIVKAARDLHALERTLTR